jgi:hypothetical protein
LPPKQAELRPKKGEKNAVLLALYRLIPGKAGQNFSPAPFCPISKKWNKMPIL